MKSNSAVDGIAVSRDARDAMWHTSIKYQKLIEPWRNAVKKLLSLQWTRRIEVSPVIERAIGQHESFTTGESSLLPAR